MCVIVSSIPSLVSFLRIDDYQRIFVIYVAVMSDVVYMLVSLAIKPLLFSTLVFLVGLRTTLIILYTWTEIIKAAILLHLNIFSKFLLWTIAFVSLPFRLLTAIHREKQLEKQIHDTQLGLEAVLLDLKEFEDCYQKILNEHKMLEMMLSELVDEHEKALDKLEQFEDELENLKMENARLRKMGGMELRDFKNLANIREDQDLKTGDISRFFSGLHLLKSDHNSIVDFLQNLFMCEDELDTDAKSLDSVLNLLNSLTSDSLDVLQNVEHKMALDRQREIALKRSLFSSVLSFSVGIVIWEAKDPCMPLVMALFTVVGMSLISVVHFFSTIRNKPASDAVALLSLNWFVLGMLTYPTLPMVTRMLAPMAMTTMEWIIRSLRFSPNS